MIWPLALPVPMSRISQVFFPCRPARGSNVMLAFPPALMRRTLGPPPKPRMVLVPFWVKPDEVVK